MSEKIYWNLLVLFGVLCPGIIGTLSGNNNDDSLELLVRQKRVINRAPGGDVKVPIRNFPFIVSMKPHRSTSSCVGSILRPRIVLTAARCVDIHVADYRVYSSHARLISAGGGPQVHHATDKRILHFSYLHRPDDGIALVTVDPPFTYSPNTSNILFYEGHIYPGLQGVVSGWGCNPSGDHGTDHPFHLRSITVPVISRDDCQMLYYRTFPINENDICTLDATNNQYCGLHDIGAPLVIKVHGEYYLAGVHLWNGGVINRSNPDVFVNLQNHEYKLWILQNIHSLEALHGHS